MLAWEGVVTTASRLEHGQGRFDLRGVEPVEPLLADEQHRQRGHAQGDQLLPRLGITAHVLLDEQDALLR